MTFVKKGQRLRNSVLAAYFLIKIRVIYLRGQRQVAARTAAAIRRSPANQSDLDRRGVEVWHLARAVWRAKGILPFHSTCLQTALATQMLLESRGVESVVRIGVRAIDADAHAWVEVGDFILDDQRIASRFVALEAAGARVTGGER